MASQKWRNILAAGQAGQMAGDSLSEIGDVIDRGLNDGLNTRERALQKAENEMRLKILADRLRFKALEDPAIQQSLQQISGGAAPTPGVLQFGDVGIDTSRLNTVRDAEAKRSFENKLLLAKELQKIESEGGLENYRRKLEIEEPFKEREEKRKAEMVGFASNRDLANKFEEIKLRHQLATEAGDKQAQRQHEFEMEQLREKARLEGLKPKDKKPPTESQQRAALYGKRVLEAEQALQQLEKAGFDPSTINPLTSPLQAPANLFHSIKIPYLADEGIVPNVLKTGNRQSLEQAEDNFINATLRRESGAVISDAERANARRQYFPQFGDSDKVKEQKKRNRETVIKALLQEAAGEQVVSDEELKPLLNDLSGSSQSQSNQPQDSNDPLGLFK